MAHARVSAAPKPDALPAPIGAWAGNPRLGTSVFLAGLSPGNYGI